MNMYRYAYSRNMNEYINFIKSLLKIKISSIKFEDLGNQMGYSVLKESVVVLNTKNNTGANLFTIAHELRHLYQYQYKLNKYKKEFDNYTDRDMMQECEKDANAFAYFIFRNLFRLEPQINLNGTVLEPLIDDITNELRYDFVDLFNQFDIDKCCKELNIPNIRRMSA